MTAAPRLPMEMVWADPEVVEAFDATGQPDGANAAAYHLNAAAVSALAPPGGTVVDLGCGSGRMLAALASARSDLRACGIELSAPMLKLGRNLIATTGMANRVELVEGNMLNFAPLLAGRQVDVLTTMWTFEHLTDKQALGLLRGIAAFRNSTGCALWIFDFVRQDDPATFPELCKRVGLTGGLLTDSIAAERAAFTTKELRELLNAADLRELHQAQDSNGLGIFQAYWTARLAEQQPSAKGIGDKEPQLPEDLDPGPWAPTFVGLPTP